MFFALEKQMYFTDCQLCKGNYTSPEKRKHVPYYSSFGGERKREREGQRKRRSCTLCIFFHLACNFQQQQLELTHSCMGTSCATAMLQVSFCSRPHLDDSVAAWRDAGWKRERLLPALSIQILHHPLHFLLVNMTSLRKSNSTLSLLFLM